MMACRPAPALSSRALLLILGAALSTLGAVVPDGLDPREGPAAALAFARGYRGQAYVPDVQYCYPDAVGVPFADCSNIVPMTRSLWTPRELSEDFQRRMKALPAAERKKGIIVILKTERCAPKGLRACTVTTAALEKRATPLAAEFLIYGVLLQPRDGDDPSGSLKIETGPDAWKNDAAREYGEDSRPHRRDGARFDRERFHAERRSDAKTARKTAGRVGRLRAAPDADALRSCAEVRRAGCTAHGLLSAIRRIARRSSA